MRILFFNPEQYVDFENESSNYEVRLPILNCGIVTEHADFVHQRMFNWHGPAVLHQIAQKEVAAFRPDVVVFNPGWFHQCPRIETLWAIRDLGATILTMIPDSMRRPLPYELALFDVSHGFIVANSFRNYCRYRFKAEIAPSHRTVFFCPGHTVFTDFFHPLDAEKTRDVVMLGSLYAKRVDFARRLRDELARDDIALHTLGGNFHDLPGEEVAGNPAHGALSKRWLPWPEYRASLNSAKICLCATAVDDRDVLNGKIFEAMASGIYTLTAWNDEIALMCEGASLGLYRSEEDCASIIRRMMRDDAAREAAAQAGFAWYRAHFDYRRFWHEAVSATFSPRPVNAPLAHLEAAYQAEKTRLAAKLGARAAAGDWVEAVFEL